MLEGILIGADQQAEHLLPWWWSYYSRYNQRPVALVDFGMSQQGKDWCQNRAQVITMPEIQFVKAPEEIDPHLAKTWKKRYGGPLWQSRQAWFKKPLACLLTPFDRTLWLDLDCEVCGSLDPLFMEWDDSIDLSIVREDLRLAKQAILFNSGVMLFRKGSPFLQAWHELCQKQNNVMMGDQDVLTSLLLEGAVAFKELSPLYNWPMCGGVTPGILIAHWVSGWGKEYIQRFGGLHTLLESVQY